MNADTLTGGLTTLEILYLEKSLEDDCKCESKHPAFLCSGEVVGIKFTACGGKRFLICQNSWDWNNASITSGYRKCETCLNLTAECWRIVPI